MPRLPRTRKRRVDRQHDVARGSGALELVDLGGYLVGSDVVHVGVGVEHAGGRAIAARIGLAQLFADRVEALAALAIGLGLGDVGQRVVAGVAQGQQQIGAALDAQLAGGDCQIQLGAGVVGEPKQAQAPVIAADARRQVVTVAAVRRCAVVALALVAVRAVRRLVGPGRGGLSIASLLRTGLSVRGRRLQPLFLASSTESKNFATSLMAAWLGGVTSEEDQEA